MGDWKDIDDAPINLSVLLYCPDEVPMFVSGFFSSGQWNYTDEALADICPTGPEATHWMLFPAPPEANP